jgi:glucokinase
LRTLAFDLGGTRLKAGLVDSISGEVEHFGVANVAGADAETALNRMAELADNLATMDAEALEAVGLAVPGLVAPPGRVVALPGKLAGIIGRDLSTELSTRYELPALVVNDAVAYGVGESTYGAARGHDRAVVVTIGTGVGVSVIQDGMPITTGMLGGGVLGGQIPIADDPDGPTDTSGRRGTIEARCRAQRLVDLALGVRGAPSAVPDIYDAAGRGDPTALGAIDTYREDLARALVALGHAHTPSVIVVGGGPMHPDSPVFEGLEGLVNDALWPGYRTIVVPARLDDHAALLGLARLCERNASRSSTGASS